MLIQFTTDVWHFHGVEMGKIMEVLATRTDSNNILIDFPLGAAYFPKTTIPCSPNYSVEAHKNKDYAWVSPNQFEILADSVTNRTVASFCLSKEES